MATVLEKLLDRGQVKGEAIGEEKTLLKILFRLGPVSDSLAKEINSLTDIDELDRLTDIALDSRSLDEFMKHLQ